MMCIVPTTIGTLGKACRVAPGRLCLFLSMAHQKHLIDNLLTCALGFDLMCFTLPVAKLAENLPVAPGCFVAGELLLPAELQFGQRSFQRLLMFPESLFRFFDHAQMGCGRSCCQLAVPSCQ